MKYMRHSKRIHSLHVMVTRCENTDCLNARWCWIFSVFISSAKAKCVALPQGEIRRESSKSSPGPSNSMSSTSLGLAVQRRQLFNSSPSRRWSNSLTPSVLSSLAFLNTIRVRYEFIESDCWFYLELSLTLVEYVDHWDSTSCDKSNCKGTISL